ncbi:MAG: MOSC domain-containing protein [Rhodobacteraceae bacterium]|nr:MOSC domain-containing protein [Paracoccaceae bacterium]
MTTRLAHIFRHPIKSHGREALASVHLSEGRCLPFDRLWAVAHEAARLEDGWTPCQMFSRGAKSPALMAITARLDEGARRVTLAHPDRGDITLAPDDPADLPGFLDWVRPLCAPDRPSPARIVSAGRGMTDSPYESVSILGLASLRALGQRLGRPLSPDRFRGNLWIENAAPFEEFDWVGREIAVGAARLKVVEPITRCTATEANPDTGRRDAPVLAALEDGYGHQEFGVYAEVVAGGEIAPGDAVRLVA